MFSFFDSSCFLHCCYSFNVMFLVPSFIITGTTLVCWQAILRTTRSTARTARGLMWFSLNSTGVYVPQVQVYLHWFFFFDIDQQKEEIHCQRKKKQPDKLQPMRELVLDCMEQHLKLLCVISKNQFNVSNASISSKTFSFRVINFNCQMFFYISFFKLHITLHVLQG